MIYARASAAVYEAARAQVDAVRGLPANGQVTSFTPAADAPTDGEGRVYVAFRESDTAGGLGDMLDSLVSQGLVELVTEGDYRAALPQVEL